MWIASLVPVGFVERAHREADPVAEDWIRRGIGEPQVRQKPRRTFSDERYQVMFSVPSSVTRSRGMSVPE